ncbi:MAG: cytochrome C [Candidatus Sedimenticola endophacoides]|uniref:Cytochrome C n=2 Tax=Candidatus Sedimenticola endophacoides TaxID=2548426 RepID=A0A657PR90_9GAMM|nr:MAG: cytochrome C [Candidatus Sedimenticola endophacoides]OQX34870.1 MAG: cytochrome C [Candidatus Sedimenticola endophacoides]OQX36916.1 MAG: cytochrome C [Candidatus Sedimenticola endophacoides]OQX40254.1 MAG: cytochrome C [Candidatus Sedimenticola endophacoides]OQX43978.1 MAG: cytochrome C [Candidatus Sedimenticola endophacoides]
MTAYQKIFAALGIASLQMVSTQALAMDGAELYVERTCIACHGAEGRVPVMSMYPALAGQNAPYMVNQMKDIKSGARNNSHSMAMANVMHMISDEEMNTVAEWLAGLPE